MGRLFDAVSALLGIRSYNHYEGECAIMLENFAYVHMQGIDVDAPMGGRRAAWCDKISAHEDWREAARLAHKFHLDVAEAVLAECRAASAEPGRRTRKRVALSGGVFQNRILLREVTELLQQSGFDVYMNESVPANDGGIALGQAYIGMQNIAGLTGSG
jgi:hydrogenase maturation protein HypF